VVGFFRFVFVCTVLVMVAVSGLVGIAISGFSRDLPDYQQLAHYQPPIITRVYAGDGRLLAELAAERRVFVPIDAIPKRVINAFLSAKTETFTPTMVLIGIQSCAPRSR
jgi:penicillin-binding protein 1A